MSYILQNNFFSKFSIFVSQKFIIQIQVLFEKVQSKTTKTKQPNISSEKDSTASSNKTAKSDPTSLFSFRRVDPKVGCLELELYHVKHLFMEIL